MCKIRERQRQRDRETKRQRDRERERDLEGGTGRIMKRYLGLLGVVSSGMQDPIIIARQHTSCL